MRRSLAVIRVPSLIVMVPPVPVAVPVMRKFAFAVRFGSEISVLPALLMTAVLLAVGVPASQLTASYHDPLAAVKLVVCARIGPPAAARAITAKAQRAERAEWRQERSER